MNALSECTWWMFWASALDECSERAYLM